MSPDRSPFRVRRTGAPAPIHLACVDVAEVQLRRPRRAFLAAPGHWSSPSPATRAQRVAVPNRLARSAPLGTRRSRASGQAGRGIGQPLWRSMSRRISSWNSLAARGLGRHGERTLLDSSTVSPIRNVGARCLEGDPGRTLPRTQPTVRSDVSEHRLRRARRRRDPASRVVTQQRRAPARFHGASPASWKAHQDAGDDDAGAACRGSV